MLEELRELGFSWIKIGEMLGVSWWTIQRRVEEYGLQNMTGFHHLPDEELDEIVRSFISDHGRTTGSIQVALSNFLFVCRKQVSRSKLEAEKENINVPTTNTV